MLAILDPILFEEGDHLEDTLRQTAELLVRSQANVPETWPYWTELEKALLPLKRFNRHLDVIRRSRSRLQLSPTSMAEVRGLESFCRGTSQHWQPILRDLLLACAASAETVVVTRLVEGRNVRRHFDEDEREALREKTLWQLEVDALGNQKRIPLVCTERNLRIPWTTRFDDALPASEDRVAFPFCPPAGWWNEDLGAWGTSNSRLCWFDNGGQRSWANPRTKGERTHWDVYLETPSLQEEFGLPRLNIGKFRSKQDLGGHLHHVPTTLKSRLEKKNGWKC